MADGNSKIPFEVPTEMRDFAAKSLEQAKRAVDGIMGAAEKAASTAEQSAHSVQAGAKDLAQQSMSFTAQSVAATFAMMEQFIHAKGMEEVFRIQGEFVQGQVKALQDHAKSLGATIQSTATAAKDAARK